jgi:hypothetical protein
MKTIKYTILAAWCVCISIASWAQAPKGKTTAGAATKAVVPSASTYSVSVKATTGTGLSLQSFVTGRSGDNLLVIGGRTNGFHGTNGADPSINFPTYYSNSNFVVYNPLNGTLKKVGLPQKYFAQLSSTNLQAFQDGNTLIVCGGYGKNNNGKYVTFNGVMAINVNGLVNAIIKDDTLNLDSFITSTVNDDMAVTGGELFKVGNFYYLVMGQNFTGMYAPTPPDSSVQKYTNEIRQFRINLIAGNYLSVQLIQRFTDDNKPDSTTQFHRRDLNVVPIIDGSGKDGLAVYGGVFTYKYNGVFVNPVYLLQDQNNQPYTKIDNTFIQQCNQYGCAQVLLYDKTSGTMITSLLGGISYYDYNPSGTLVPVPTVPFVKIISTIYLSKNGTTSEYVTPKSGSLTDFVGAESKFFPLSQYLVAGNEEIIDWNKLPDGNTVVGYMYGGIKATASQSSYFYPTSTNSTLYQVIVTKTASSK